MFLPRSWEARWRSLGISLPGTIWLRHLVVVILFAGVITLTIASAHLLRAHVINSLQINVGNERVTVFLAPVSLESRAIVAELLNNSDLPGSIAYVAPTSWQIPELGFKGAKESYQREGTEELLHPTTHGNPLVFDQKRLNVLLVEAATASGSEHGIERLTRALNIRPVEFAQIDIVAGKIGDRRPAASGDWDGIPVPTF